MRIGYLGSIIKKELKAYFDSPTAYVVLIVFVGLWLYLFFRTAFLIGDASVRMMLDTLPWLLIIMAAAMTMGSLAAEKSQGTLEFLLTRPVGIVEILVGKFIAGWVFMALALLPMVMVAISFSFYGNVDWGLVAGGYLASLMSAGVLVALGIMVSAIAGSQIMALLLSAAGSFGLLMLGTQMVTMSLPLVLVKVVERLSLLTHFESMARGVVDLRDLIYFGSMIGVFLGVAYLQIIKIRYGNKALIYRRYMTALGLIVAIAVSINLVGHRIPGRIDLTGQKLFTLSGSTREVLNGLDDVVNVKLYASSQIPVQLQSIVRDTRDMLRDYETVSGGKVRVTVIDPSRDRDAEVQAQGLGIGPVQFNVVGQEELQLKQGYLGLAVVYGGEYEVMPLIQSTNDLEYQLTSFIYKLTNENKKVIGFTTGHGEKALSGELTIWERELKKQFSTVLVDLSVEETKIDEQVDVLVMVGPSLELSDGAIETVRDFLNKGGAAMVLASPVRVDLMTLQASETELGLNKILSEFGVSVMGDLVYDLRSNETVNFGGGGVNYIIPYPFWVRSLVEDTSSPIVSKVEGIVLPWASSLGVSNEVVSQKGLEIKRLLTTSENAGRQIGVFSVTPDQELERANLDRQLMAVSIAGKSNEGESGRLMVVGNAEFVVDEFVPRQPANIGFVLSGLEWLAQEKTLSEIKLKDQGEAKLMIPSMTDVSLLKYGNYGVALGVIGGWGGWRLWRRQQLKFRKYREADDK